MRLAAILGLCLLSSGSRVRILPGALPDLPNCINRWRADCGRGGGTPWATLRPSARRANVRRVLLRDALEIGPLDLVNLGGGPARVTLEHGPATLQHVDAIGDAQRLTDVLLDQ